MSLCHGMSTVVHRWDVMDNGYTLRSRIVVEGLGPGVGFLYGPVSEENENEELLSSKTRPPCSQLEWRRLSHSLECDESWPLGEVTIQSKTYEPAGVPTHLPNPLYLLTSVSRSVRVVCTS